MIFEHRKRTMPNGQEIIDAIDQQFLEDEDGDDSIQLLSTAHATRHERWREVCGYLSVKPKTPVADMIICS